MKFFIAPLLALWVVQCVCETSHIYRDFRNLTVHTSTGIFTGVIEAENPNVRQWRAVPYAEPPVASNRWLPPQKLASAWNEHRYAHKYPPSCPQFISSTETLWNRPLTKGNLIYNGAQNDTSGLVGEATSEDCLYLAVWAPTEPPPENGYPVLFFMTGGGFYQGGINLPWQIPTSWVERSQSTIVVTINYRLNIFGFPNAQGLAGGTQNLGILDQRAALEWVRDNIAAFGGNPSRIMHWGRSSGAISADVHAYAYPDDPIAQSFYLESGTVFSFPRPEDSTHSNFSFVARHVGCDVPSTGSGGEDAAIELDCMRQVSATQILHFIGQYVDGGERPTLSFQLIPDDLIVFRDYEARSEEGLLAHRPTMVSFTANEWSGLVPWPADNVTEGPWQVPITSGNLAFGTCATLNSTIYRNKLGDSAPVFRFQYAATFPNLNVYDWMGAYHNSETPLIFGTYDLLDHVAHTTEFQVQVSEAMQDHIIAFAKDPYHGPQKEFGWAPQNVSEYNGGSVLRFGAVRQTEGEAASLVDGAEIDAACTGRGEYDSFP